MKICSHPGGCERPVRSKGLCEPHYSRLRKTGSVGSVEIAKRAPAWIERECSVDGCSEAVGRKSARGMCNMHYLRWRSHGDPSVVKTGGASLALDRNPNWSGDKASYNGVHQRLAKQRGRAKEHLCACGNQARHWSYNHLDPNEKQSEFGPYSTDLSFYEPLCVPCHKRFDLSRFQESENESE